MSARVPIGPWGIGSLGPLRLGLFEPVGLILTVWLVGLDLFALVGLILLIEPLDLVGLDVIFSVLAFNLEMDLGPNTSKTWAWQR